MTGPSMTSAVGEVLVGLGVIVGSVGLLLGISAVVVPSVVLLAVGVATVVLDASR